MAKTLKAGSFATGIPAANDLPLWATEDTLKDLVRVMTGKKPKDSDAGDDRDDGSDLGGGGVMGMITKALKITNEVASTFAGDMGDGIQMASKGLGALAGAAGKFGPAVSIAADALNQYGILMSKYLDVIGDAIDAGLGFSSSLGASAAVAGTAGLNVKQFYNALGTTGGAYRTLGDSAMDAASNFGTLQSAVRDTYGTFGLSNSEMAGASADYVKLVAQSGARNADALSQVAGAFGSSMEAMRKISIATGVSMKSLQGGMKDLIASPIISNGIKSFGLTAEDATVKMSRGAAGFEALLGRLGKDLYKQMAEAQAAGLSIINTELGAQIAPYMNVTAISDFQKMLQEGTASAEAMSVAQRRIVTSTAAMLPTLRLQAQQGDAAAKNALELYNSAAAAKIMTQEELDRLALKKRSEEKLATIQQSISAAYAKVTAKLYGFLDAIPVAVFEAVGKAFNVLGAVAGVVIDVLSTVAGIVGTVLIPIFKTLSYVFDGVSFVISKISKAFDSVLTALEPIISAFSEFKDAVFDVMEYFEIATAVLIGGLMVALAAPLLAATGLAGALAGLVTVSALVYDNWDYLSELPGKLWTGFKDMLPSMDAVKNAAKSVGNGLLWVVTHTNLLGYAALKVYENWETLAALPGKLWDSFTGIFTSISDWYKNSWFGKGSSAESVSSKSMPELSNPMGDSGTAAIMDSVAENNAEVVVKAVAARDVAQADTTAQAQAAGEEHMAAIRGMTQEMVEAQKKVAANTAETASAVKETSTSY